MKAKAKHHKAWGDIKFFIGPFLEAERDAIKTNSIDPLLPAATPVIY